VREHVCVGRGACEETWLIGLGVVKILIEAWKAPGKIESVVALGDMY
jgi:hypothetical protein